jgi:NADH:ubiquinone oxidoreductase subunit 5 (subunit L)/multisubunit Na+/H+ antiporter MnhA subunit
MCAHEPQIYMSLPLLALAVGSLFVGFFTKDMIIGLGSPF